MSRSLLLLSLVAALLSQSLVMSSVDDQKNYFGHHHRTPFTPSTPTPSIPTPTPSIPTPTPSIPTPSTPSPSHGSSGRTTPSTPRNCPTPSSKSPPSSGHSGGYTPSPSTPSTPRVTPTPSTPRVTPTPSTPIPTPTTPSTPPFVPDPNSPPFTCRYWRNHPQLIWGLLGWWGTLGNTFGVPNVPGVGAHVSLRDALGNTQTGGYAELSRQATAAFLNSMVDHRFAYSTQQVRDAFVAALPSDRLAAIQANVFRRANEARH